MVMSEGQKCPEVKSCQPTLPSWPRCGSRISPPGLPLSCILARATTLAGIVMVATSANEWVGEVTTTACSSSCAKVCGIPRPQASPGLPSAAEADKTAGGWAWASPQEGAATSSPVQLLSPQIHALSQGSRKQRGERATWKKLTPSFVGQTLVGIIRLGTCTLPAMSALAALRGPHLLPGSARAPVQRT